MACLTSFLRISVQAFIAKHKKEPAEWEFSVAVQSRMQGIRQRLGLGDLLCGPFLPFIPARCIRRLKDVFAQYTT